MKFGIKPRKSKPGNIREDFKKLSIVKPQLSRTLNDLLLWMVKFYRHIMFYL